MPTTGIVLDPSAVAARAVPAGRRDAYPVLERLSRDELQALQLRRLNRQLERLWQNDFYAEGWTAAGLAPGTLAGSLDDLRRFPVITKEDVLSDQEAASAVRAPARRRPAPRVRDHALERHLGPHAGDSRAHGPGCAHAGDARDRLPLGRDGPRRRARLPRRDLEQRLARPVPSRHPSARPAALPDRAPRIREAARADAAARHGPHVRDAERAERADPADQRAGDDATRAVPDASLDHDVGRGLAGRFRRAHGRGVGRADLRRLRRQPDLLRLHHVQLRARRGQRRPPQRHARVRVGGDHRGRRSGHAGARRAGRGGRDRRHAPREGGVAADPLPHS